MQNDSHRNRFFSCSHVSGSFFTFRCFPDSAFCHPEAHAGVGGISTGKPVFYRVVKQDPASNIDHYADAILLNILYHFDSAHPVTSPLTASYYYTETHNENENLYTAVTSDVTPTYDYFRYWHGSTIFIRPLLTILNLRQIYIFLPLYWQYYLLFYLRS